MQRIQLLNVPIDILEPEEIDDVVQEISQREGCQRVVFLTIWDLLKARHNNEFRQLVLNAAIVLPVSKSIVSGAKFLKKPLPVRRQPFDVIIDFLNAIDSHYRSLYLLGGRRNCLLQAEKNVKSTFPNIKLIGKHTGFYPKGIESDIITAIAKSQPEIVLIANGIPSGRKWAYRHRDAFKGGIFIYYKNIIDIFAKTKNRVSDKSFNSGMDYIGTVWKNPFRIFNFFRYLWYRVLLLHERLFKK